VIAFAVLANFYSKGFPLGTLYENYHSQLHDVERNHIKVRSVCLFRHIPIFYLACVIREYATLSCSKNMKKAIY
jgi:hypothetical protein